MISRVRVRVPASTSNLGPGFDVLGMALTLHNSLEVERLQGRALAVVEVRGEGAGTLPTGESNLVVKAFRSLLPVRRFPWALRFRALNRIPLGRGLGSSAAARLAGLMAAAAFLEEDRPAMADLVLLACRMEGHPDNVIPAFFGGLCASLREGGDLRFARLRRPAGLSVVVCVPEIEVSTKEARGILPRTVSLDTAVRTMARLALLVTAFEQRRYERLAAAMDDVLHQPYRKKLTPGMDDVISAALASGACGAALSGSGPSVLAFAPREAAAAAGRAMERAFSRRGLKSRSERLGVDASGLRMETWS